MNKFMSVVSVAAVAMAVSFSVATPSSADDVLGAGIVGGVLGFVAGSALADSGHHRVYVQDDYYDGPDYDYRAHVNACMDAYRSYDLRTDTYAGYDGYRHQCNL